MVDAWENSTTKTWAKGSPKHGKTQFSISEREQEQALINGFQKKSSELVIHFPPARTKLPFSSPTVGNVMKAADTSTYLQEVKEFPEPPGEPECEYFMKTGRCKYRSACKFQHPKSRASESSVCA